MTASALSAIDLVEASYDLEAGAAEWLPQMLAAGAGALDMGMGASATINSGLSPDGQPLVVQMVPGSAGSKVIAGLMQAAHEVGADKVQQTMRAFSATPVVLSEHSEAWPEVFESITRHVGCKDIVGLSAFDPDASGVSVVMPCSQVVKLDNKSRERLQMLAVHIAAGHRLRRGLSDQAETPGVAPTDIPLNAEALLDPKGFLVSQAAAGAQTKAASKTIREAAVRMDRARGKLRKSDPAEALGLWKGLVRGRWSLIDWFDTDGRRFVLAKPNAPRLGDPRGLTEREHQVATYAGQGESSKLIGYRLGLSPQRISKLLNDGMRKLGVKTQPQLVEKLRGLPSG